MPELPSDIRTELLYEAHIDLAAPEAIGQSPFGARAVYIVTGGTFEGPKMRGTVRPGGGDWFLSLPNGAGELDVRATLETDDGALILITYHGILDVKPEVIRRVFAGEDVSPTEYYFRTTPRLETGDERYAWLNKTICVATGYFGINKVGYRVFAVR
ncbi:MAG: DUF3237 domain-containing protein [Chloroflexi bacterium]|nr:DUF3237 domain-containing protein [Chloroflexota bacterium]